jgi:hypothetical protein
MNLEGLKNLHSNIANDVWPNGQDLKCGTCGKVVHLTTEECGQCLAHGWPKCCGYDMAFAVGKIKESKNERQDF